MSQQKKYNVLLLMTDQHRADCLGCYGNPVIETPNLDWIASQGSVFVNAYSATPSCIPARACLITGMDQWNTGILGMGRGQGPMGVGFEHTLPGELANSGYHTCGVGKMHFHPQRSLNGFHRTVLDESSRAFDPGFVSDFKQWFDRNKTGDYDYSDHGVSFNSWMSRPSHAPEFLHPTNWTVNESIKFLKERDPSKPFFLKTSFARPHSPYDAPQYYFDMYKDRELPQPYVGEWATMHDKPDEAMHPDAWRGVKPESIIKRARAGYYGSITHIDQQIGRLLQFMTKSGILDNTLIIFTSDHGDMLGDHNLWRKTYAYEGSSRIPMIIRLPKELRINGREYISDPVGLQDIMPTCLDVLGLDIPDTVDGLSMYKLMSGDTRSRREFIHGEHSTCYSEEQEMQYLTDGSFKYIWFPKLGTEQLFNIAADRSETKELSSDPNFKNELLKWRNRLVKILEERNCGLTRGNELVCQTGQPPIISPNYKIRLDRSGYLV